MSVKAIAWAWEQEALSGSQKLLLVALADHANDDGECWPGNRSLARKCGVHLATIKRTKQQLVEGGYIRVERRKRPDGSWSSSRTYLSMGVGAQCAEGGADCAEGWAQDAPPMNRKDETPEEPSVGGRSAPSSLGKEWYEWLGHFHSRTGKTRVRGSKADRAAFRARRDDGYSLDDLKLAIAGCVEHVQSDRYWTPETILRDKNCSRYIAVAQKSRGPAPKAKQLDSDKWLEEQGL